MAMVHFGSLPLFA